MKKILSIIRRRRFSIGCWIGCFEAVQAVTLHVANYNFCRVHSTLKVTPAMEGGLTDPVWALHELLAAI